jgi:hypothetical protein
MVDKADEKKGQETARPPKGEEASDVHSSATVVRETPSDLVELIKRSREGGARPVSIPPNPVPKDLTGSHTAKTSPPPSLSPKNEPPLSERKPAVAKKPGVPNKVDDLWEALLPKRSADDDDDDDDALAGSASGHAAEDVTKMLTLPEGLIPDDPLEELGPDALRRIAQAGPSIVLDDGIDATHSSAPPRRKSSIPPRSSSEPPPSLAPASARKQDQEDEEDEGLATSPGRKLEPRDRQRIQWMVLAIGALVLLALAVYYVAQQ